MNERSNQYATKLQEPSEPNQATNACSLFRGYPTEASAMGKVFQRPSQMDRKLRDHLKNEPQMLASRILTAQEEERKDISASLNDDLCQSLFAIKLQLEGLLWANGQSPPLLRSALKSPISALEKTIHAMQTIISRIRPSILDDLGVIAAISWLCSRFEAQNAPIRIEKRIDAHNNDVPQELKTVVFSVLQEALNNIAKHSHADRATVSFKVTAKTTELTIENNGPGFNSEEVFSEHWEGPGLGLSVMREHVASSGGSLDIWSTPTPGQGTMVRALWPKSGPHKR